MTKIRKKAFANRIEEYLTDPSSYEETRFDKSLFTVVNISCKSTTSQKSHTVIDKELHGLCFGPHIELVMILLDLAYRGLNDKTTLHQFSKNAC